MMHFPGLSAALPNLETQRLIVRLAEQKDRDQIISYLRENQAHLQPFSPAWPRDYLTKRYWELQIQQNLEEFYSDVSVRLFVFQREQPQTVIGTVGLGGIMRNAAHFCFMGYGLAEQKQGQGLMSEAVAATVNYAFDDLNFHRVQANYIPTNERSGNLLKRLGFVVEGYARDYLLLNGKWQDHILTSKTNPNWKS